MKDKHKNKPLTPSAPETPASALESSATSYVQEEAEITSVQQAGPATPPEEESALACNTTQAEKTAVEPTEELVDNASSPVVVELGTGLVSTNVAVPPHLPVIPELPEDEPEDELVLQCITTEDSKVAQPAQQLEHTIAISQLAKCNICRALFTELADLTWHTIEAHQIPCKFWFESVTNQMQLEH